jgi:hypothetical protein
MTVEQCVSSRRSDTLYSTGVEQCVSSRRSDTSYSTGVEQCVYSRRSDTAPFTLCIFITNGSSLYQWVLWSVSFTVPVSVVICLIHCTSECCDLSHSLYQW